MGTQGRSASLSPTEQLFVCLTPYAGEVSRADGQSDQGAAEQPSHIRDQEALSSQVCNTFNREMKRGIL